MKNTLFALAALILPLHGQFQVAWQGDARGTTGLDVALGDIDGDGDVDAVLAQLLDPSLVLVNDGTGKFTSSSVMGTLPLAAAGELADLDGDGDLDLFLAGSSPCQVFWNDGAGVFTNSGQNVGGFNSRRSVVVADVDGDGDRDAVLPTNGGGASELWLNNGAGIFSFGQTLPGDAAATNAAVVDVNGDGRQDIVLACNGPNLIFTNNGAGSFVQSAHTIGSGATFCIAFADFDGDGDQDAFVADGFNPPFEDDNEVWLNDGAGVFTRTVQDLGTLYSFDVLPEDIDGDGDMDVIVGNNMSQPNEIWLNNGAALFTRSGHILGHIRAMNLAMADLDGDGDSDCFIAGGSDASEVWKRVPSAEGGPFKDSGQRIGGTAVNCVAKGDFDGDGDPDIALGTDSAAVRIMENTGGSFSERGILPLGFDNNARGIACGDFNADGHQDLFAVGTGDGVSNKLWFGDGSGQFTASSQTLGGEPAYAVAAADIDGDGDLDAVVGTSRFGNPNIPNKIHRNNGDGTFVVTDGLGSGKTRTVAFGFFNNDAFPDLVVGDTNQPATVWFNNGSGTFANSGQSLASGAIRKAVVADFNGDGKDDILFAIDGGGSKIWSNNGSGTFVAHGQDFNDSSASTAAVLDYDGDGDLDFWLGRGGAFAAGDSLFLNDGTGLFSRVNPTFTDQATTDVVAGDFNGDGAVDLFASSYRGDHILWSQEVNEVQAYAASFGLSGDDTLPLEDPDGDGVLNFEEMAFNMNPNLADNQRIGDLATSTRGTPRCRIVKHGATFKFIAETIFRFDSEELDYRLQVSSGLVFGPVPSGVTMTTAPLDAKYHRATFEYIVPGNPPKQFGRFRVIYSP
ncbi:VCBS repeat-containing protein [Luteolibacter sp. SL250]|uniref:FG-GAP repeat domain-containing protein n=1 Tax=Luteolibacter sp. SL250 TaxID=2995170 RepID=UPI00226DBDE7|nr:VCBS repeat-containing protein [Luteolibacter sp. SL250]WAC20762.1 VCBS repeat-containing protein [Luteolibacter sp. SL250]